MKIYLVAFSLFVAMPVFALRDHWLDADYQGTDISYTTGRFTRGDYAHDTFKPSPHPYKLPTAEVDEWLLQPEKLTADLKTAADWAFDHDDRRTQAMLLIDHGHIVYERNVDPAGEFNSWSMSKSITSLLVGKALCQGDIKSLDDTAGIYAPEIKDSVYGKATIRELLSMKSGSPPLGDNKGISGTGTQVGDHWEISRGMIGLTKFINDRSQEPGPKNHLYDNLNIDTLSLVLDHLRGMHVYMQGFLNEAGVEKESHWIKDKDGHINAAYGYGASLQDWGHIAQYSLDILKGRTKDKCMQQYMVTAVQPSTQPKDLDESLIYRFYGYGFGMWTHPYTKNGYAWMGMYGQKVWVNPKHDLILIVFRNHNSSKFSDNLGNLWVQWRAAHEPRPEDIASGKHIKGNVDIDFVEAQKDTKPKAK